MVRDRKEELSLSDKAYPLELVLLPGSARISQPLWRIILGSMRSEGSKRCQLSHSTAHPPIPSLQIGTTCYRMIWLAMNMISSSHGLHMEMIFCGVYLLPSQGRFGPMSVGYLLLRSLGLMGELSI